MCAVCAQQKCDYIQIGMCAFKQANHIEVRDTMQMQKQTQYSMDFIELNEIHLEKYLLEKVKHTSIF